MFDSIAIMLKQMAVYSCQNPDDERCGFFLWREDAEKQAAAAMLNTNSRSERSTAHAEGLPENPIEHEKTTSDDMPPAMSTPEPALFPSAATDQASSSLNTAAEAVYAMSSDDERAFGELLQRETPSESSKAAVYTTPVKRKFSTMISQGLATPVTGSRAVDTDKDSMRSFLDLVSPDSTPTPLRFRDAMPQSDFSDSLLTDLLNMFQEEHTLLTESSKTRFKDFCVEHSRRTSGLLQA
jgi:hypothetical protein